MKTEINIDKLILHGFPERDAFYIRRAVLESLTRMIETGGLAELNTSRENIPSLSSPEVRIKHNTRAETTGREIARSIFTSLQQPTVKKPQ